MNKKKLARKYKKSINKAEKTNQIDQMIQGNKEDADSTLRIWGLK